MSPYLLSIVLFVLGLIALAVVGGRTLKRARGTKALLDAMLAVLRNERGLLRARYAGLRFAFAQRRKTAHRG